MQCASCSAHYDSDQVVCPQCRKPASSSEISDKNSQVFLPLDDTASTPDKSAAGTPTSPTLIEFPGVSARRQQPQWRKDLSERVRMIQERRAKESNYTSARRTMAEAATDERDAGVPRLVPHVDPPPVNPLVAAALRRIERARESAAMHVPRSIGRGGAATAVARVHDVMEEAAHDLNQTLPTAPEIVVAAAHPSAAAQLPETKKEAAPADAVKAHKLVAIPTQPITKNEFAVEMAAAVTEPEFEIKVKDAPKTRRVISEVVDDALLARREAEREAERGTMTAPTEILDDQASVAARATAVAVDLFVVAFAASPFAAIIELTSGNWGDWRVAASMIGIVALVLFLYSAAAVALAGRTWGMSLVSLFVVDVKTGLPPTLGQSVRRAFFFLISFVTLGLGALYSLYDAERRALHDHLSNTIVVRD